MLLDITNPGTILFERGNQFLESESFNDRVIKTRLCYTGAIPFFLIRGALEAMQGVCDGAIVLATGGYFNHPDKYKNFNARAIESLDPLKNLLVRPYACILKLLDPNVQIPNTILNSDKYYDDTKAKSLNGLRYSASFFERHIKVRLKMTVELFCQIIIDIAHLAFGLIAATFSLITLGKIELLNTFSLKKLESPLIQNLFYHLLLLINPWAIDYTPSSFKQ